MSRAARFLIVTRLARVIAIDVPHHVTQRGNARKFILDCDADRMAYLNLLRQNIELHGVGLISYCLMSNHVAVVVVVRVWGKSCLSPGWASVPA
jgi:putative transposase